MKKLLIPCLLPALLATPTALFAAESNGHLPLGQALGNMVIFAIVGIAVAVIGYKVFDKCTPGDLNKEIVENRNIAAAIVAAAVILGVCIIVAVSMIG